MSMEELRTTYENSSPDAFEHARSVLYSHREHDLKILRSLSPRSWAVTPNDYALIGSSVEVVESAA